MPWIRVLLKVYFLLNPLSVNINEYGPDNAMIDIMKLIHAIRIRWHAIYKVIEPDHLIHFFASYDLHQTITCTGAFIRLTSIPPRTFIMRVLYMNTINQILVNRHLSTWNTPNVSTINWKRLISANCDNLWDYLCLNFGPFASFIVLRVINPTDHDNICFYHLSADSCTSKESVFSAE